MLTTFVTLFVTMMLFAAAPGGAGGQTKTPTGKPADRSAKQQEWDKKCISLGHYASEVAKNRDAGIPPSASLEGIQQHIDTEGGRRYMRRIVLTVHKNWWMTPVEAQRTEELACLELSPYH